MKAIPALSTTTQRLLLGTTLCLSVLVLAGCARHGAGLPPNLPAPLLPHHQLVIYAPHGWQCPVVGAASEGDLEDGEGKPLDGYDQPTTVMVKDTEEHGTWLALEVQSPGQKARWLRVPHSTAVPCLLADADALQRALDQIGKRLVFTPWKPACHELHIAGQALDALFIENSPGVLPKVTALALGPESATERAANKSGTALWLDIKKSGLAVRAERRREVLQPRGRCTSRAARTPHEEIAHTARAMSLRDCPGPALLRVSDIARCVDWRRFADGAGPAPGASHVGRRSLRWRLPGLWWGVRSRRCVGHGSAHARPAGTAHLRHHR